MPPYEPVFKVVESEYAGVSWEKLSMESTVATYRDYVIHIVGIHVTLMRPDYHAKANLGRPPLPRNCSS